MGVGGGGSAAAAAHAGSIPARAERFDVLPASLAWVHRVASERPRSSDASYARAKRLIDVTLVALSAPLVLPVLAVCWIAVRLEAPRARAIFVQQRTGRDGKRFRMYKFRTMVPDAESRKADLMAANELRWPDFKIEDDPRITRLGRVLRKTSLDELPQLFNVLKGDMSLVGPRPTSFGAETYQEWHRARLAVPPGITGLWQIAGRGEMEFDERVRLDVAYIQRRSVALDLMILARTVGAVLARRGAH